MPKLAATLVMLTALSGQLVCAAADGVRDDNLPVSDPSAMNFGGDKTKAWKDIWGSGQGIGAITAVTSTAALIEQLSREYAEARQRLLAS